ncbi:MAG: hypothetical protein RIR00_2586, partial [Pseudomonadota bacterium]
MDNRRLILLLIFCFSLVMTWDAWQKHNQPKPVTATSVTPTPTISAGVPQPGAALQPGVSAPAVATQAQLGQTFKVKTDLFAAEIASRGGDLVRLELLKHKDQEDKNKNLVLFEPGHKYYAQSGLIGDNLPNHKTELKLLPGPLEMAEGSNELKVRLEAPVSNGVKAVKVLSFKRGSYQIDVAWEIENGSPNALAPHAYFQIQRDNAAPAGETQMVSTFTGPAVYTEAEKYQKVGFEDIAKDKAKFNKSADNGWLAMVQHYYVSAWVPQGKTPREFFMRKIEGDEKHGVYAAGVILPMNAIAGGSKDAVSVPLYAGPQEQATLKQLAEGLDLVVDYGWLAVIAAPIFWFLEILHKMVGNWGWAIVLLTIAIKLAFFPLSAASYRSMAKMRQVAPRMQHLKERFGDDRQRLNQEMMKLYQSEKINPLGGCL